MLTTKDCILAIRVSSVKISQIKITYTNQQNTTQKVIFGIDASILSLIDFLGFVLTLEAFGVRN